MSQALEREPTMADEAGTIAWLVFAALALSLAAPVRLLAQGREAPNIERSSAETLFEQSDLGNVVRSAAENYRAGARELVRAEKLVANSRGLAGKKRERAEARAATAYTNAMASFEGALGLDLTMGEAHVGLAQALRGLGKNTESLLVLSRGLLELPGDTDLDTEWSRSVSALDMAADGPRVYLALAESDRARAEALMGAMKQWLALQTSNESAQGHDDVDRAAVRRLEAWIAGRQAG